MYNLREYQRAQKVNRRMSSPRNFKKYKFLRFGTLGELPGTGESDLKQLKQFYLKWIFTLNHRMVI